jgi:phosphoribosylformylglycinamidine (FGAM) synthase-like amidotransferase family enzyme
LSKEFEQFFLRSDTLVLGFGNGGQILAYLQELIPDAHWPIPQKNVDNEFHSRKFLVDILPSPCVVLKDLENTRLMTSFGCRFGHISKVESKNLICAITKNSVIDSFISVENNPLHNDQGAYGFTTNSGRVSWFLFHPEYHVENHQYDFYQPWVYNQSPWAQLFYTMMNWLVKNRQAD